jgi:hypothetical protein
MKKLKVLDLSNCKDKNVLKNLPNVEKLILHGMQLGVEDFEDILAVKTIQFLDISECGVRELQVEGVEIVL